MCANPDSAVASIVIREDAIELLIPLVESFTPGVTEHACGLWGFFLAQQPCVSVRNKFLTPTT
jgi:hypothetical protein